MNEVSVDEAIAKGHRMVTYPVMVILFGILGLCMYLGIQNILTSFWMFPALFALAFLLAWLYWSLAITKWRLWAFENVRNVHELKKRAIQEKLIWKDDSLFQKTEIRNTTQKEKWNRLQSKFEQDDIFKDDFNVPDETIIYYAKGKNFLQMVFMLCFLGAGIFLATTGNYLFGSIVSVISAYLSFKEYREATNIEPQIIINSRGIKTISTGFYAWKDIENEEAISEQSGKYVRHYLVYDHPEGAEHLGIDDYNTDMRKLNKLLIVYRGRNREQTRY